MPSQEEFDELKGRVTELENQLQGRAVTQDIGAITAEEMETYIKVRDILTAVLSGGTGCAPGGFDAGPVQRFGDLGG
jgi:hypothetical protein